MLEGELKKGDFVFDEDTKTKWEIIDVLDYDAYYNTVYSIKCVEISDDCQSYIDVGDTDIIPLVSGNGTWKKIS